MLRRTLLSLLFFLLLSATITYAETSSLTTTPVVTEPPSLNERLQNLKREVRQKNEDRKLQIDEKGKELRKKIEDIKDERKKKLVEKLSEKINNINKRKVAKMAEALKKLETILSKITSQQEALKQSGINTDALENTIEKAKKAITTASAAVDVQSKKTYEISFDSEDTMRNDIGKTVKELENDLREVHKLIIDAKQTVQEAAKELRALKGETPKVSPSITPTI
jgi:chromosome segregation ATPase